MLVNKVTVGFVVQVFDTKARRFTSQEFVAGDQCEYKDERGEAVDSSVLEAGRQEAYLPFHMVQPEMAEGAEKSGDEPR